MLVVIIQSDDKIIKKTSCFLGPVPWCILLITVKHIHVSNIYFNKENLKLFAIFTLGFVGNEVHLDLNNDLCITHIDDYSMWD